MEGWGGGYTPLPTLPVFAPEWDGYLMALINGEVFSLSPPSGLKDAWIEIVIDRWI